jgi:hypothetical protein
MGNVYSIYSSYDFDIVSKKILNSNSNSDNIVLINTLPQNEQDCLIKTTIHANKEADIINGLLKTNYNKEIIIYGKNHRDVKIIAKYNQLKKLGFKNVHIYFGGMFEWLLLKEVYGDINFQIDGKMIDILKYK